MKPIDNIMKEEARITLVGIGEEFHKTPEEVKKAIQKVLTDDNDAFERYKKTGLTPKDAEELRKYWDNLPKESSSSKAKPSRARSPKTGGVQVVRKPSRQVASSRRKLIPQPAADEETSNLSKQDKSSLEMEMAAKEKKKQESKTVVKSVNELPSSPKKNFFIEK